MSYSEMLGVIASGQMKIYLTDQADNFDVLLKQLTTKPTMTFDKAKLKEKSTTIDIKTEKTLGQINLDFFLDYKIFPSNIMTFMTEWEREKRKMRIGDTILQQAFIPPTKTFSQKIVFGVRINSIILILDNWRLFRIKKREDYFDKVREGQYIQIKRTGTHKLINYYVYDKKASA